MPDGMPWYEKLYQVVYPSFYLFVKWGKSLAVLPPGSVRYDIESSGSWNNYDRIFYRVVVASTGIEPVTQGFSVLCSTI